MDRSLRAEPAESRGPYLVRLLHSFAGAVPFAVLMLLDLWVNAKAADGPVAFARALEGFRRIPTPGLLAVLSLPAYHALVGGALAVGGLVRLGGATPSRDFRPALRRASGLVVLGYVAWRIAKVWVPLRTRGVSPTDVQVELVASLSSTWHGVPVSAYLAVLALGACSFHLGDGLARAATRWGLGATRARRLAATWIGAGVGLATFLAGSHSVLALATGWAPLGRPTPIDGGACGATESGPR